MNEKHPLSVFASEQGESMAEIAKRAEVSRQTLYRIMSGKENTTLDTLRRISAATGGKVSVSDLIGADAA